MTAEPRIVPSHPSNHGRDDPFTIAGETFHSRLMVGTGKYRSTEEMARAIDASGAQIVTVAIRRVNLAPSVDEPNILSQLSSARFTILPNSAGCYSAKDAVRTLFLARDLLDGHDLVKLEVLGDPDTLYPNIVETLKAAEELVRSGFRVMAYTSDDPVVAKELETIGCVAVMPLASLIGSGMGIVSPFNLRIILEHAKVPVIVDAGVGRASDAAIAMEYGCAGVLTNTAIAEARDPVVMAKAMALAVSAGRSSYLAGPMAPRGYRASASSPAAGHFI